MRESYFQQEIAASARTLIPKAFYYKIPDPQYPKRDKEGDGVRRIIPRPYDCQILTGGVLHALELKLHKKTQAFPLDAVKPVQIESLKKVKASGGAAGILVNIRLTRPGSTNMVLVLDVEDFCDLRVKYHALGRKSIPFKELAAMSPVFARHPLGSGKYGWNIPAVLMYLRERRLK